MSLYLGKNKIASGGLGTTEETSESSVKELKINYLTEKQYLDTKHQNQLNDNELYMTPDDRIIVDYVFPDSNQKEVSFPVKLKPSEHYKIKISGAVNDDSDVYLQINDIDEAYYQVGEYLTGNFTTDESLNKVTGFRANKNGFYYAHSLRKDVSHIEGDLSLEYSPVRAKYFPVYTWKAGCALIGHQMLSNSSGVLVSSVEEITKLKFFAAHNFLKGTRILIVKNDYF